MSTLIKNLEAIDQVEGRGNHTHTFKHTTRVVQIHNDSSGANLTFAFSDSENGALLLPTETATVEITAKQIIITGTAAHRIWAWS